MGNEIDLNDDNLTLIRKRIARLQQEVRETGDLESREQLVAAYHNYGVLVTTELARRSLLDERAAILGARN